MDQIQRVESSLVGTTQSSSPQRTTGASQGLGRDAFLKLLLAQLRNQDPLKPMEDKDFIVQLAQFNTLEAMQEMNQTLKDFLTLQEFGQASALIGKTVSGYTSGGELVTGLVEAVLARQGKVFLQVEGKEMPLAWVASVTQGE